MGAVWPRPTAGARRFGYDVRGIREPECSPIHAGEVLRIRGADALFVNIGSLSPGKGRSRSTGWGAYQDSTLRGEPNCPAPEGIRDAVDGGPPTATPAGHRTRRPSRAPATR